MDTVLDTSAGAAVAAAAPYVRPDVQAFLTMIERAGAGSITTLPIEQARSVIRTMNDQLDAEPRPLAVIRDLSCPGPAGAIPLRLYDARESRGPGPVVVYFHGGGFAVGDLDSHHSLCTELAAELDLPVIAVDYRLAPEHPFPAAPDDCEAAARWVAASPDALGRTVTGLITAGDSAGGNMTIVVTQQLTAEPAAAPVLLQAPIYPAPDGRFDHPSCREFGEGYLLTRESMEWFSRSYAAKDGDPRAYPILGEHRGTPPTVVVTAGLDPLRDGGRDYAAQLARAGSDVVYLEIRGTIHGFVNFRKAVPSAQADLLSVLAAVRLLLGRVAGQPA